MSRARRPGPKVDPASRQQRLLAFFDRNPDEWLTVEDIAVKLECTHEQALTAVKAVQRKHGLPLRSVVVYRLEAAK